MTSMFILTGNWHSIKLAEYLFYLAYVNGAGRINQSITAQRANVEFLPCRDALTDDDDTTEAKRERKEQKPKRQSQAGCDARSHVGTGTKTPLFGVWRRTLTRSSFTFTPTMEIEIVTLIIDRR